MTRVGSLAAMLVVAGCQKDYEPPQASSDVAPAPLAPSVPIANDEDETRPVEMLKSQFTTGIKDKNPIDRVTSSKGGERIYFHMTVRNRTGRPRKLHVAFLVNDQIRTEVDLEVVESWSYRTWAYNTLTAKDQKGKLEVRVTDEEGNPLADESLTLTP